MKHTQMDAQRETVPSSRRDAHTNPEPKGTDRGASIPSDARGRPTRRTTHSRDADGTEANRRLRRHDTRCHDVGKAATADGAKPPGGEAAGRPVRPADAPPP